MSACPELSAAQHETTPPPRRTWGKWTLVSGTLLNVGRPFSYVGAPRGKTSGGLVSNSVEPPTQKVPPIPAVRTPTHQGQVSVRCQSSLNTCLEPAHFPFASRRGAPCGAASRHSTQLSSARTAFPFQLPGVDGKRQLSRLRRGDRISFCNGLWFRKGS